MSRLRVIGWLAFAGLLLAAAYSTAGSVSTVAAAAAQHQGTINYVD